VVVSFIDSHRVRFGVEPICRVLSQHGCKIAPSTYYAHRSRLPSARAVRDVAVLAEVTRVHSARDVGRGLYGARKVWLQLAREGIVVPRCQVERLMRAAGLRGIRRGRQFITTRPDRAAARPPDLVRRDFTAAAPNLLWVVDFTYVPTWAGMAFTAFVTDVFSRRIVGWRTAASMPTGLPLDALEMALWTRASAGQSTSRVVHHSDSRIAIYVDSLLRPAGRRRRAGLDRDRRRLLRQRSRGIGNRPVQDRMHPA
jgi:putative transposase